MPILIPKELPAYQVLQDENIFAMTHNRAISQDIRPLEILIVNLMPDKIVTETQLARLLANSPLQVRLTLLRTGTHESTHTSADHLAAFYKTLEQVKQERYDGMIITGAPVEHLAYENVDYWQELCGLFDFARANVYSTIYLCWGAMAGLKHHYGIPKKALPQKLSGIFEHKVHHNNSPLVRGFDEYFFAPHSRNAGVERKDIEKVPGLQILAESPDAGVHIVSTQNGREIFILGHMEYDKDTLYNEYTRDLKRGLNPAIPTNYFENDDSNAPILYRWRAHANLLFYNWLNYYVYQTTPFNLNSLNSAKL